ncbi:MAG: hypothetical protein ACP5OP_08515 [Leptospirillia bacterium]
MMKQHSLKIPPFLFRTLAGVLLLLPLSCQSASRTLPPPSSKARFEGVMRWKTHPISRAALFLSDKNHPGPEIEFLTRADGRFSYDLPPGTYLLRSAPTTMCPIKGEVRLKAGENSYTIKVHPLSFLSCRKGTIQRTSPR